MMERMLIAILVTLIIILLVKLMNKLPGHTRKGGVGEKPIGPRPNIAPPAQGPRPEQVLHVYHHMEDKR